MNSGMKTIGADKIWAIGNIAKQCWVKNRPRTGKPRPCMKPICVKTGSRTEPLASVLVKWHETGTRQAQRGTGQAREWRGTEVCLKMPIFMNVLMPRLTVMFLGVRLLWRNETITLTGTQQNFLTRIIDLFKPEEIKSSCQINLKKQLKMTYFGSV